MVILINTKTKSNVLYIFILIILVFTRIYIIVMDNKIDIINNKNSEYRNIRMDLYDSFYDKIDFLHDNLTDNPKDNTE